MDDLYHSRPVITDGMMVMLRAKLKKIRIKRRNTDMDTRFYIDQAVRCGDKRTKRLYKKVDRGLTQTEMRLITRLVRLDEALSHEEAENLGFGEVAKGLRRLYKDVNGLLARTYKMANNRHIGNEKYYNWLKSVNFVRLDAKIDSVININI